jgi:hypothetical protein
LNRLVLSLLVIAALAVLAASSSADAPAVSASTKCSGSVDRKINGHKVHAHKIRTLKVGCKRGKRVISRFLKKANRDESCNAASKMPAPTNGCVFDHWHCFRNGHTYCATPTSKDVTWRE